MDMMQSPLDPVDARSGPAAVERWSAAGRRSLGWPRIWLRIWPFMLAVALPLAIYETQGRVGLGLGDEGFLWYGAQRVLAGEVPVRDFQSYDVGRYYWSAAWMAVVGNGGVVALRFGNAALACVALVLAATLLRPQSRDATLVTAVGLATFALWIYPDFKVADAFAVLLLTASLARTLRDPGPRRWAIHGVAVGVAAAVGINHALYGVVALALAWAWLYHDGRAPPSLAAVCATAAGAAAGYAPVLALHAFEPGFTAAYVDFIGQLFEAGVTNVHVSPPSLADAASVDWRHFGKALRTVLKAVLFVAAPVFMALCVWRLRRGAARPDAVFVAAVATTLPYAHYAYSRADLVHVAISALPLMVALWTFPVRRPAQAPWFAPVALFAATAIVLLPNHPGYALLRQRPLEPVVVFGETVRVTPPVAQQVALLARTTSTYAPGGRAFYVAPYWPAAYALAGRRAPTWEIYSLLPITVERQRRELQRLAAADLGFALLATQSLDDRDDLGFGRTHPIVADALTRCLTATRDLEAERSGVALFVGSGTNCLAR